MRNESSHGDEVKRLSDESRSHMAAVEASFAHMDVTPFCEDAAAAVHVVENDDDEMDGVLLSLLNGVFGQIDQQVNCHPSILLFSQSVI